jgi:hypothetical protein
MKSLCRRRPIFVASRPNLKPNLVLLKQQNLTQRPLMKRLEKFTNKDLATEKITVEYINDITVGWDIDEVSYSEVIELLRRLAKKMLQENIEIPNHLWNGWIYVILMNESPEKSRIPSFKYLGRPNSIPQTEKIRAIDIFLNDMDVFQESNSFAINQVNRLFNFLLEFETCSSDVNVLLRGFLKFDQNLRSSLIWEKIIVKFMYYKCLPFEDIIELLRIMILDEEKVPSDHFAPVLKHWIYENRNTYNSFSSRFIDRIGFTKLNTLNNLLIGNISFMQLRFWMQITLHMHFALSVINY